MLDAGDDVPTIERLNIVLGQRERVTGKEASARGFAVLDLGAHAKLLEVSLCGERSGICFLEFATMVVGLKVGREPTRRAGAHRHARSTPEIEAGPPEVEISDEHRGGGYRALG